MPPRIEVGRVAGAATLEIDAPEGGAAGIDATTAGSVEHGYAVRAAHAEHGIDHTLAVASGKAIAHPRREENYRTADEDVTKTYAYQAAEMLHADSRIVAYSGNGVLSRWIAPEQDTPYTKNILPEIFPYIQNEVPDLIVCNLGTNDASYVRQIPSRERAFVEKYTDFIQQLKKVFADAKILLLYGLMEQTLCEKVQETAQRCGTEFLKLPLQNPVNGMGTDGHPGARTQQEIALYVERYMEQMMMWRTDER